MTDRFEGHQSTLTSPCSRHYAVTAGPAALDPVPRALFVGVGGTVTIADVDGTSVEYTVADGAVLPFRAAKVTAATAAGIVAWY